ncbi:hypothetical protein BGZ83_001164, partial [Gryganskiella cystojenkinii]
IFYHQESLRVRGLGYDHDLGDISSSVNISEPSQSQEPALKTVSSWTDLVTFSQPAKTDLPWWI